ncbi:hypothetical protein O3M35_002845 [Rhynocoris fuscipes]|uniref:Uncharacterized protein n=1 Tax=Rhynocoris fuscipes TaxID=488301 RepID=A0AAW1CQT5_9HEMI
MSENKEVLEKTEINAKNQFRELAKWCLLTAYKEAEPFTQIALNPTKICKSQKTIEKGYQCNLVKPFIQLYSETSKNEGLVKKGKQNLLPSHAKKNNKLKNLRLNKAFIHNATPAQAINAYNKLNAYSSYRKKKVDQRQVLQATARNRVDRAYVNGKTATLCPGKIIKVNINELVEGINDESHIIRPVPYYAVKTTPTKFSQLNKKRPPILSPKSLNTQDITDIDTSNKDDNPEKTQSRIDLTNRNSLDLNEKDKNQNYTIKENQTSSDLIQENLNEENEKRIEENQSKTDKTKENNQNCSDIKQENQNRIDKNNKNKIDKSNEHKNIIDSNEESQSNKLNKNKIENLKKLTNSNSNIKLSTIPIKSNINLINKKRPNYKEYILNKKTIPKRKPFPVSFLDVGKSVFPNNENELKITREVNKLKQNVVKNKYTQLSLKRFSEKINKNLIINSNKLASKNFNEKININNKLNIFNKDLKQILVCSDVNSFQKTEMNLHPIIINEPSLEMFKIELKKSYQFNKISSDGNRRKTCTLHVHPVIKTPSLIEKLKTELDKKYQFNKVVNNYKNYHF